MTENQILQVFIRLLRRERRECQEKPAKKEGLFSNILKLMKRGEK